MTQPAKVQEPSMEEILASIRRIIADDEAKPPAAEKPASPAAAAKPEKPAAPPPAAKARRDERHSAVGHSRREGAAAKPAACAAARQAGTRAGCEQQPGRHRRDAGRPGRSDTPRPRSGRRSPRARCSNSPTRWRCRNRRRRSLLSRKSSRRTISNSPKPLPGRRTGSPRTSRRRLKARSAAAADPVALDRVGGGIGLQQPCQHSVEQQCADAGRPGQGNAAADAEILARRQPAGAGGTHRQGRNRAGFARPLAGLSCLAPHQLKFSRSGPFQP